VRESIHVTRDGTPLNEQELGWWEQFLHDLLPPGLADLFFFDGEQIQALADDPDYTLLGEAIRSLLGLDLLDRLRGDLAVYLARQRRSSDQGLDDAALHLQARRSDVEQRLSQVHSELAELNSQIAQRQGKIEDLERRLASEGGMAAARREQLKQRAASLSESIHRYERLIAEQANTLLPFAVVPQLAQRLKARLELDERVEQHQQVASVADAFVEAFMHRLFWDADWLAELKLSEAKHKRLVNGLERQVHAIRASLTHADEPELAHEQVVHALEKAKRKELISWLDQALVQVPMQLAELGHSLEQALAELVELETILDKLPAEESIQPILQQLKLLQREVGALEVAQQSQELALKQARQQREALEHEEKDLSTRLMRGDDPSYRARMAGRAQQALVRYEAALRQAKLSELETSIVACFGRLSRKGRYIQRVVIDPDSFATTLYNQKGDALPREQLSAGEKQIYAVALLWALRLVSGRTLPIIVDTPLGRLDSEHRQHLVQRYFPQASHQVVLLSTDTELDPQLYAALAPAIARAYQLVYQPGAAASEIQTGYFWPAPDPLSIEVAG
jgi:DNA sulfur modification protein DndD